MEVRRTLSMAHLVSLLATSPGRTRWEMSELSISVLLEFQPAV